jgi:predicted transposase/invertase (TIGR01784 family)
LEIASFSRDELYVYDRNIDAISTQRTLISGALAEGMAKGMAEGMAEGRAEGRAEGEIKRHEDKREMALRMKAKGFSAEDIAEITGLAKEEIDSL